MLLLCREADFQHIKDDTLGSSSMFQQSDRSSNLKKLAKGIDLTFCINVSGKEEQGYRFCATLSGVSGFWVRTTSILARKSTCSSSG